MRVRWLLVISALLVSAACGDAPSEAEVWNLAVPAGDPAAGRDTFVALGCVSCHGVVGDERLPSTVSAHPGPELGMAQIRGGSGALASHIVLPNRRVDPGMADADDPLRSPMGDYTESMTVRQLTDLVAYIRHHADEETRRQLLKVARESEQGIRRLPL